MYYVDPLWYVNSRTLLLILDFLFSVSLLTKTLHLLHLLSLALVLGGGGCGSALYPFVPL